MNNANVAHAWAHQTRPEATGSNMFFDGDTIYSFGLHYKIAIRLDANTYLLNDRGWGSYTGRHTFHVRRAIPHGATIVHVPDLNEGYSANMEAYCRKIEGLTVKLVRARKSAESYLCEINNLFANAKAYEDIKHPEIKDEAFAKLARKWSGDSSALLEAAKIQAAKQAAAAKIANAKAAKIAQAYYATLCREFANYERSEMHLSDQFDRVRISKDGQSIETSKRIIITIAEARRFADSGLLHKVDRWAVNKRDAQTITIGCHKFEITHLLDIASKLPKI